MPRIKDFPILDFSGGVVTNKSDYVMNANELTKCLNFDIDKYGKLKRRRGMVKWGQNIFNAGGSGILASSTMYEKFTLGSASEGAHVTATSETGNGVMYWIRYNYLTAAAAVGDTTVTLKSNTDLSNSGSITINGDEIAYTGKDGGGNDLTGVSGIARAHPVNSVIVQLQSKIADMDISAAIGIHFAQVNNLLIACGSAGSYGMGTWDLSSWSAVSDEDKPGGIYPANYRDRLYVAGSAVAEGAKYRNPQTSRISFSSAGDATAWDINDFFDVEDSLGQQISGLVEHNDVLLIFKAGSVFAYDEVQLKQTLWGVGAYDQKVIRKIDGLIYTFCPRGIFVTNGVSAERISDPVKDYLTDFQPQYSDSFVRIVHNCFAAAFDGKYYLYIKDIENPESLDDVVLVYDTEHKNWTVYDGFTEFTHFEVVQAFGVGVFDSGSRTQREAMFGGDRSGNYWRMFEDRIQEAKKWPNHPTVLGGDIIGSPHSDSIDPIQCVAETPLFDLGSLDWKTIGHIQIMVEEGEFEVFYQLDKGTHITDWIPLGTFNKPRTNIKLPHGDNEGYRIKFRITNYTDKNLDIFNGIVVREIDTVEKVKYG